MNCKVKQEMCKRWVNGTTFTAPPIELIPREEETQTQEATPSMRQQEVRQPKIMLGGVQQRARGGQEESISQEDEEAIRQAMLASLETAR